MKKEIPILFQDEMVLAIEEDRKNQTRRLNGLKHINLNPGMWVGSCPVHGFSDGRFWEFSTEDSMGEKLVVRCPYGMPGDRLWVRQAFRYGGSTDTHVVVNYRAGDFVLNIKAPDNFLEKFWKAMAEYSESLIDLKLGLDPFRFRPSIHLPRWACGLILEVVRIRCERIQGISEDDARAEGVEYWECGDPDCKSRFCRSGKHYSPRAAFMKLWDLINGKKYPVALNPWVWVVQFKIHQNLKL